MAPQKNTNKHSKPGWKIRLETQKRKLRQEAKILRQKKNVRICRDEKHKETQLEQTIQHEEINQKLLSKEER